MNKSGTRVACLLLSAMTAFSLVSCTGDDKTGYDRETRPLVMATEALDGNFNPFFATSATDSEMASMTQLGMLTTDDKGNIVCGEDQPTVVLDYKMTEKKKADSDVIESTTYEFIIKNGIKFSDGTPLTIKDVLFNLYVYLDPAYMGSATMYSTDIKGLKNYRAQQAVSDDYEESDLNDVFYGAASLRTDNMLKYLMASDHDYDASSKEEIESDPETLAQVKGDIQELKKMFREEVESDWTASQGQLEGYEDEYSFTEDWQVFYFNEGYITIKTDAKGPLRDKDKKYITNITPDDGSVILEDGNPYDEARSAGYYNEMIEEGITAAKNDEAKISAYMDKGADRALAIEYVIRDTAIDTIYNGYTKDSYLPMIIDYWATGSNLTSKFVAEAKTAYYEEKKENNGGDLLFDHIEGISATKTSNGFDGSALDGEHEVLKIEINGVDPKAIYNFSFAVAPLHYYSGKHKGVDYVSTAKNGTNFGVAFGDSAFFENVLQADEKNKKPMGAGVYQVSNQAGRTGDDVDGSDFYSNNWVYFARNNYFETVGSGLHNANIKYLRYKVVNADNLVGALLSKDIDVGEPNAKPDNISRLDVDYLAQQTVDVNGYGYVGVNPKYVPDIEVRQAIMKAMNPSHCISSYYTEEFASVIYRSMSSTSWVWDNVKEPTTRPDSLKQETDPNEITKLVGRAGWKKNSNGKYAKGGKTLKFTFTIAGATEDHPAYTMFAKAAEFLNQCGFEITVATDISALKKLATGQLAVWAAAWSSTVDPDMYQVYHKDSKATSVNNWGYPTILHDDTDQFVEEQATIDELSTLIVEAREMNSQSERSKKYLQALNLVMDLAVELPTYQRKDCVAYNKQVINPASLNRTPTPFAGVIDKIWEVDYNG